MNVIQTHAAPDLLTLDKLVVTETDKNEIPIIRVGEATAMYTPIGDSRETVLIKIGDLRGLVKAGYKAGWNGKAIHWKQALQEFAKEIGG